MRRAGSSRTARMRVAMAAVLVATTGAAFGAGTVQGGFWVDHPETCEEAERLGTGGLDGIRDGVLFTGEEHWYAWTPDDAGRGVLVLGVSMAALHGHMEPSLPDADLRVVAFDPATCEGPTLCHTPMPTITPEVCVLDSATGTGASEVRVQVTYVNDGALFLHPNHVDYTLVATTP